MIGPCRLCNERRKLVKAHIIPQSFYEIPPQATGQVLKLVSTIPDFRPAISRKGVYDPSILCESCEDSFSEFDDYAASLLRQSMHTFIGWGFDGVVWYYTVPSFKYSLLKMFFMSVLWRAAVSRMPMFSRVQLPEVTEKRLRAMVRGRDAGEPDNFAVNLAVYDDEPAAAIMLSPIRHALEGIECIRFKMHRYVAHIKIDHRQHTGVLRQVQLSPFSPPIIMCNQWRSSSDFKIARKMVRDLAARGVRVF